MARAPAITSRQALGSIHVRVRGLRKSYEDHVVLDGLDLDVHRNAMNVILGVSGCGKTVLLRQLLRLERPDAGTIEVDGQDIASPDAFALQDVRRTMGVVFQDSALVTEPSLLIYDEPTRGLDPVLARTVVRFGARP